jgi:hypothetical protein
MAFNTESLFSIQAVEIVPLSSLQGMYYQSAYHWGDDPAYHSAKNLGAFLRFIKRGSTAKRMRLKITEHILVKRNEGILDISDDISIRGLGSCTSYFTDIKE